MMADRSWAREPLWYHFQTLRDLLAEEVEQAQSLVDEATETIRQINRSQGKMVYLRLVLRQRRPVPELHWFRTLRGKVAGPDGRKIGVTMYLGGLRDCRYRSESFAIVPVDHRSTIMAFEARCVPVRRRIREITQTMRQLRILAKEMEIDFDPASSVAPSGSAEATATTGDLRSAPSRRARHQILEDN